MEDINADTMVSSCTHGAEAQESARTLARADVEPDHDAGEPDLQHRGGQHQPGDAERDEERGRRDEDHPRQDDHRQGRPDHVRIHTHTVPSITPSLSNPTFPEQEIVVAVSWTRKALADVLFTSFRVYREELSDQRILADEIGNAIATGPQTGEALDETELEEELEGLEQEALDEKMLKTGSMPVMPSVSTAERESLLHPQSHTLESRAGSFSSKRTEEKRRWWELDGDVPVLMCVLSGSKGKSGGAGRGRGRGGRAQEVAGRDGDVRAAPRFFSAPFARDTLRGRDGREGYRRSAWRAMGEVAIHEQSTTSVA